MIQDSHLVAVPSFVTLGAPIDGLAGVARHLAASEAAVPRQSSSAEQAGVTHAEFSPGLVKTARNTGLVVVQRSQELNLAGRAEAPVLLRGALSSAAVDLGRSSRRCLRSSALILAPASAGRRRQ